ncbi:hypothetical protein SISSUDRAFT_1033143 [Sistotremastrum suecicum HHB10207 ss-3]|uniref:Uncharacterized protein n=1 Tax=Sistotremastrum suecicum HHB10207 ss-3 TaxID=1314776 RepID=A0A166DPZ4_9AGAM|nr:hypothetical protein SISSUDRAFT_1033143 [Sistotremastrum suecicum HHB10207 ss-3]
MAGPHRAPFPVRMFRCIHRLEETIGISCGLYGILLTLFIITLHVFLFEHRSRGSFAVILSMLLLTMSIATVTFGLTIIHEVGQFHPKTLSDCQGSAITSSFIALVPIQLIFVDIFAVPGLSPAEKFKWTDNELRYIPSYSWLCPSQKKLQADALPLSFGLPLSFVLNMVCTGRFTKFAERNDQILPVAVTHTAAITFDIMVLQIAINKVFYQPGISESNPTETLSKGDSELIESTLSPLRRKNSEADFDNEKSDD